ncbi:unnamed protein product, partial [Closterium sp. NIES-54]
QGVVWEEEDEVDEFAVCLWDAVEAFSSAAAAAKERHDAAWQCLERIRSCAYKDLPTHLRQLAHAVIAAISRPPYPAATSASTSAEWQREVAATWAAPLMTQAQAVLQQKLTSALCCWLKKWKDLIGGDSPAATATATATTGAKSATASAAAAAATAARINEVSKGSPERVGGLQVVVREIEAVLSLHKPSGVGKERAGEGADSAGAAGAAGAAGVVLGDLKGEDGSETESFVLQLLQEQMGMLTHRVTVRGSDAGAVRVEGGGASGRMEVEVQPPLSESQQRLQDCVQLLLAPALSAAAEANSVLSSASAAFMLSLAPSAVGESSLLLSASAYPPADVTPTAAGNSSDVSSNVSADSYHSTARGGASVGSLLVVSCVVPARLEACAYGVVDAVVGAAEGWVGEWRVRVAQAEGKLERCARPAAAVAAASASAAAAAAAAAPAAVSESSNTSPPPSSTELWRSLMNEIQQVRNQLAAKPAVVRFGAADRTSLLAVDAGSVREALVGRCEAWIRAAEEDIEGRAVRGCNEVIEEVSELKKLLQGIKREAEGEIMGRDREQRLGRVRDGEEGEEGEQGEQGEEEEENKAGMGNGGAGKGEGLSGDVWRLIEHLERVREAERRVVEVSEGVEKVRPLVEAAVARGGGSGKGKRSTSSSSSGGSSSRAGVGVALVQASWKELEKEWGGLEWARKAVSGGRKAAAEAARKGVEAAAGESPSGIVFLQGLVSMQVLSAVQVHVGEVGRCMEELETWWDAAAPTSVDCSRGRAAGALVQCARLVGQLKTRIELVRRAIGLVGGAGREEEEEVGRVEGRLERVVEEGEEMQRMWLLINNLLDVIASVEGIRVADFNPESDLTPLHSALSDVNQEEEVFGQHGAFRAVQSAARKLIASLGLVSKLVKASLQEAHWRALARALGFQAKGGLGAGGTLQVRDLVRALGGLEGRAAAEQVLSAVQGEVALRQFMDKVEKEWGEQEWAFKGFRDKWKIVGNLGVVGEMVLEHLSMLGAMKQSPFFPPFREAVREWEGRLGRLSELVDALADAQSKWVRLEALMTSPAVRSMLPDTHRAFHEASLPFTGFLGSLAARPLAIDLVGLAEEDDGAGRRVLAVCAEVFGRVLLEVQAHLDKQRRMLPRLYFLGDDDLLQLISASPSDLSAVHVHIRKLFTAVSGIEVSVVSDTILPEKSTAEDLAVTPSGDAGKRVFITAALSDGERLVLHRPVELVEGSATSADATSAGATSAEGQKPAGATKWLLDLDVALRTTLSDLVVSAVAELAACDWLFTAGAGKQEKSKWSGKKGRAGGVRMGGSSRRNGGRFLEWLGKLPLQPALLALQVSWTALVEGILAGEGGEGGGEGGKEGGEGGGEGVQGQGGKEAGIEALVHGLEGLLQWLARAVRERRELSGGAGGAGSAGETGRAAGGVGGAAGGEEGRLMEAKCEAVITVLVHLLESSKALLVEQRQEQARSEKEEEEDKENMECAGQQKQKQKRKERKQHGLSLSSFAWRKCLRYYLNPSLPPLSRLSVQIADASFTYGFEYSGCTPSLVRTSLTDRCFLALSQALWHGQGSALIGPAGTGKTETVKALGRQLGRPVLALSCDRSFDSAAVGRVLEGVARLGAWGCMDEFNRLDESTMSAISQHLVAIQGALREGRREAVLAGTTVPVHPATGIFVTLNPRYAGRDHLPESLSALLRPLTVATPDACAIAHVTLLSCGFSHAERLADAATRIFQ